MLRLVRGDATVPSGVRSASSISEARPCRRCALSSAGYRVAVAAALAAIVLALVGEGAADESSDAVSDDIGLLRDRPAQLRDKRTWQAFKGLQYGGLSSVDGAVAVGAGPEGAVFIAGNTLPMNSSVTAWGNAAAGDQTGGKDAFIARLTSTGELAWVRRLGSKSSDEIHAMTVTEHAVYVCGSTFGDIGGPNQGESDVFVAKYSHAGHNIWAKPVQVGSEKEDVCWSIAVADPSLSTTDMFISGRTEGAFAPSVLPPSGNQKTHRFVAKLVEKADTQSVTVNAAKVEHVFQRGTLAINSADFVKIAPNNHLYVVSNQYNAAEDGEKRVSAILEILDQDSLSSHHTQTLVEDLTQLSFHATSASVMPETGELYVGGIVRGRSGGYCVAKFTPMPSVLASSKATPSSHAPTGEQTWGVRIGDLVVSAPGNSPLAGMSRLSIVADPHHHVVHVFGVKSGFYDSGAMDGSGLVRSPFIQLAAGNGSTLSVSERATEFPNRLEEIYDVAMVRNGDTEPAGLPFVVYAGCIGGSNTRTPKVLVGSVGSPKFVSHAASAPTHTSTSLEVSGAGGAAEASTSGGPGAAAALQGKKRGGLGVVGSAAVGVSAVGGAFLIALAIALATRPRLRKLDDSAFDDESAAAALAALRENSAAVGGSSAPQ